MKLLRTIACERKITLFRTNVISEGLSKKKIGTLAYKYKTNEKIIKTSNKTGCISNIASTTWKMRNGKGRFLYSNGKGLIITDSCKLNLMTFVSLRPFRE